MLPSNKCRPFINATLKSGKNLKNAMAFNWINALHCNPVIVNPFCLQSPECYNNLMLHSHQGG